MDSGHVGPPAPGLRPSRIEGIDLLRGIAIVLVVLHHVALRIPLKDTALAELLPRGLLGALSHNGYQGVYLFFVISGFLIASHSLARWGDLSRLELRGFYARRAARILPCLLVLVAILSVLHGLGVPDFVIQGPGQSLTGAVVSALGLHLNWYEGRTGWLPGNWDVLWSLSIEEVFYLGFPLLCLVLRRRRWMVAAMLLLVLSLPLTRGALDGNEIWQEKAYLPGMSAIAGGVLTALAVAHWKGSLRTANALCVLGAIGLFGMFGWPALSWRLLRHAYLLPLIGSAAVLLAGLAWRARHARATAPSGSGWLQSFGRLSYEIYLSHMFVVFAVVGAFRQSGGELRGGAWWYPPVLLLSWGLGRLVERGLSSPCDRALRARWLGAPPAIPAAQTRAGADAHSQSTS